MSCPMRGIVQLVRTPACHAGAAGSSPVAPANSSTRTPLVLCRKCFRTALLPHCRPFARNVNASNANRKKNLVPGGVVGHETLGLLRIAFAGITSQHQGKGRQVGSA